MTTTDRLRLGVALEGAGWHPAAWREESSRPNELFTPQYWVDVVQRADAGGIDFATIEDSFALQSSLPFGPDERADEVRGRLDALLIASRVAPVTRRIGLIPTVTTTHTEPFHISKAVATLDYTSLGRAGWQPKVSGRWDEARHFGRRDVPAFDRPQRPARAPGDLDAVRRGGRRRRRRAAALGQLGGRRRDPGCRAPTASWMRRRCTPSTSTASGSASAVPRSRRGPRRASRSSPRSRTRRCRTASPRHPPIWSSSRPSDFAEAGGILADVRAAETAVGREGEPLRVYADIVVFLDGDEPAAARRERLDGLGRLLVSDTRIFTGSAAALADEIAALGELGYAGVRLRPGVITDDLPRIADQLVPELRRRELLADSEATSLRGLLGLPATVPNRYAPALAG